MRTENMHPSHPPHTRCFSAIGPEAGGRRPAVRPRTGALPSVKRRWRVPMKSDAGRLPKAAYEKELFRLQAELVKLQEWVRVEGARLVVAFEGRDAAGK